jgi:hypothetical protein
MTILVFMIGILLPVSLGVLAWKKYDLYFPTKEDSATELSQYLKKLLAVFVVVFLSMYGIFIFI